MNSIPFVKTILHRGQVRTITEVERKFKEVIGIAVKQTVGRDALGEFAPKFAELNDDVLFGQVWSREDKLSLRDRSIVTVTAFMAQGLTDSSFKYHLEERRDPDGDCGDSDPCGILCGLTQGVGDIPHPSFLVH